MHNRTEGTRQISSPVWMRNIFDKRPSIADRGIWPTGNRGNTSLGVKFEEMSKSSVTLSVLFAGRAPPRQNTIKSR